jgi:hypothetical protein
MNFQKNYIKYKKKYLKLKKIQSGGVACDLAYQNIHDTCWMVATITCFCFGDATSHKLEEVMNSFKIDDQYINLIDSKKKFIEASIEKVKCDKDLKSFLLSDIKSNIFSEPNINYLKKILDKFIDRYYSKVFKIKNLEKGDISPESNTERCELVIKQNFKNIFDYNPIMNSGKSYNGGTMIDVYIFANLLSIFFLGHRLYIIKNYYNGIDKINNGIDKTIFTQNDVGIIIFTQTHGCCLFACGGKLKYYNDNDEQIYRCNNKILNSKLNNLYIEKGKSLREIDIKSYKGNKKTLSKVLFLTVLSLNKYYEKYNNNFDYDVKNSFSSFEVSNIKDPWLLYTWGIFFTSLSDITLTQKSYELQIELLEKSASLFFTSAAYKLGLIYENNIIFESTPYRKGFVIDKDYVKAFKYYKLAADQGHIKAQNKLGEFYENGYGITKDYCKALEYYKLASDQGDEYAECNLKKIITINKNI